MTSHSHTKQYPWPSIKSKTRSIQSKSVSPMHTSSTKLFTVSKECHFISSTSNHLIFISVARRKTIYEYHRVNFGGQDILNDTLILLKAMPTCLRHTDCESCLNTPTESFNCTWCPALNRCSTGTDRKRQEWVSNNCDRMMLKDSKTCPALGSKGNNYAQQQQVPPAPANSSSADDEHNRTISSKASDVKKAMPHIDDGTGQSKQNSASFALGILLPIIVIMSLVMWVFYAYRNPHTKSGQLLIQVRH